MKARPRQLVKTRAPDPPTTEAQWLALRGEDRVALHFALRAETNAMVLGVTRPPPVLEAQLANEARRAYWERLVQHFVAERRKLLATLARRSDLPRERRLALAKLPIELLRLAVNGRDDTRLCAEILTNNADRSATAIADLEFAAMFESASAPANAASAVAQPHERDDEDLPVMGLRSVK